MSETVKISKTLFVDSNVPYQKQEQQQQKQEEQQKQKQQQPQQPEQKKDEMSDQAAERLLNSAQQDEKDVQRKLNETQNNRRKSLEKDW